MFKSRKNFVIIFLIGSAVFLVGNLLYDGFSFDNLSEFLLEYSIYQLYAFVLGYSNMYFFELMERITWSKQQIMLRIVLGVLGSTLITMIALFFLRAFTTMIFKGVDFITFVSQETVDGYIFGLWVTLTIVVAFHLAYFYNRYQKSKIKEQKVIAGTVSARFDALKNQLDPHFLFNSLNVLTSLIEENPENAQKFTTSLSKIYRYVLEQKNKVLVSVDEELNFAKTYMTLLKMRFEDSIVFDIPEHVSNPESKVVPLSLQLLLENAVKHNVVTSHRPLRIKIYENQGSLVIENNLQPKKIIKKSSGVGLENIKQRYLLLTNKTVSIIEDRNKFSVSIPMLTKQVLIMEKTSTHKQFDDSYLRARKHVDDLKEFYYNLIAYCIVIPFLIFINYKTFWGFQWFWFPMFGWGLGLAFHAYKVFVNDGILGRNWEKRKIEQFMREEEKEHWN